MIFVGGKIKSRKESKNNKKDLRFRNTTKTLNKSNSRIILLPFSNTITNFPFFIKL